MRSHSVALTVCLALLSQGALAGEAAVRDATLTPSGDGTWRIEVTVEHADAGWDHYADAWDVLATDGTVLGTRTLLHPHAPAPARQRAAVHALAVRGRNPG